jgi:hypothetical protein
MSEINWKKDKSNENGIHFVAIKYGEGAGTFDFSEWDGEKGGEFIYRMNSTQ